MAKRNKHRSKKKLNIKRIFIVLLLMLAIIVTIKFLLNFTKEQIIFNDFYLSSETNQISIYTFDEETKTMSEIDKLYRGK